MPSTDDHREKAESNERVARVLAANGDYDWAVTATFYAAVQELQALIKLRGWKVTDKGRPRRPQTHGERANVIHKHCGELEADYRTLKQLSEAARYDAEPLDKATLETAIQLLANIRSEIAKL